MTTKQRRKAYYERTKGPLKGQANSRKSHCPAGHEYTEANTYINTVEKTRTCRTCNRERAREKVEAVRTL